MSSETGKKNRRPGISFLARFLTMQLSFQLRYLLQFERKQNMKPYPTIPGFHSSADEKLL